jgi:hypothetical protein
LKVACYVILGNPLTTSALLAAVSGEQNPLTTGVTPAPTQVSTKNGAAKATASPPVTGKRGFELGASVPVGDRVKITEAERRKEQQLQMEEKRRLIQLQDQRLKQKREHQALQEKRRQQEEIIRRQEEQIRRQQRILEQQAAKQSQMSGIIDLTILYMYMYLFE